MVILGRRDYTIEIMKNEITKRHDEMLHLAFERAGFTMDYLKEHADEFSVVYGGGGDLESYMHNKNPLFSVISEYDPKKNCFRVSVEFPPNKGGETLHDCERCEKRISG